MVESKSKRSRINRVCIVVLIIILIIPLANVMNYNIQLNIRDAGRRVVLYQSPAGGEDILISEWKFGEVVVDPPPTNMMNMYSIHVSVLDWDNCEDMLDLMYGLQWMDIYDFQSLNASRIEALFRNGYLDISYNRTQTGESSDSFATLGRHVWALRYVGSYGDVPATILRVSIRVSVLHEQPIVP